MAGRKTSSAGTHEAEGVAGGGQFVVQPESEQDATAADTLNRHSRVSALRVDMHVGLAEGHVEEAFSEIRSSWATRHTGSKTDRVFWAKQSLESAITAQAEAIEKLEHLADGDTDTAKARLDANELQIQKLTRWLASADTLAKEAAASQAEFEAMLAARGSVKAAVVAEVGAPDGSADNPVKPDDPRLLAGEVFDTVEDAEGTVFHRRRDGVFPGEFYTMRFQADRKLTPEEIQQFAGLVGYTYRSTVAGERLDSAKPDTDYSFTIFADSTKSSRDDVGMALEKFEEDLPAAIRDGSPVRKTNQSGEGTKGTRLVEGFGEIKFEIYYDSVE